MQAQTTSKRRTRCARCRQLGCAPARHCARCGHPGHAHGYLSYLSGPFGCAAMTVTGAGLHGCECPDYQRPQ